MDSESQNCHRVIGEIARVLQQSQPANLSPSTYDHISTCSRCRAGLLLLVRRLAPELDDLETPVVCAASQADLPAFIDLELEDAVLAATTYPHVWWHLWMCQPCSQIYEMTHTLLEAESAGELPPFPNPIRAAAQPLEATRRVHLTRQMLAPALLEPQPCSRDRRYVLYATREEGPACSQLTIAVQEQADGSWQLIVTAHPPPAGLLVFGSETMWFVSPFGADGVATIDDIPADVLTQPGAAGLAVSIVPIDAAS